MKRSACGLLVLLSLCVLAGVLTPAWSQEVTAAIVGTITDPSGAPIKGAKVVATDAERGTVWNATTNDTGAYNLLRLPVGNYTVRVTAQGFQSAMQQAFTLTLNQTARVDVQLKVGNVSETVEVTSAAPILQTQSTEVSNVVESNTITTLPLVTRNYMQLTLLTAGATTPSADEFQHPGLITNSGRPYINGNREQANAILIDGIDASENSNNEVGYSPNPDAIQEFNLITQNASAEFGSYEGGVISTTIKSGTNNLHGSAFEFYRDGNLNANDWANGLTKTPKGGLVYNQFGATIGGPIIRNRVFFFADYQGQRFVTPPSSAKVFVFSSAERSGNFGELCTGLGGTFDVNGNCTGGGTQLIDPATDANIPYNNFANASAASQTENPVAAALLATIPQGDATTGLFSALNGQRITNDQGDLKIDYNVSDKDHIYGRWSQGHIRNPFTSTFALSSIGPQDQPVKNFGAQWMHQFTPKLLNEARIGFNTVVFDNPSNVAGNVGKLAEQIGITGGNAYAPGLPAMAAAGPTVCFTPVLCSPENFSVGSAALFQNFHTSTPQAGDIVSVIRGNQQIKIGFQYERIRLDNVYSGNGGELGQINFNNLTGSPLADFWMGNVSQVSRGAIPPKFGRRANVIAGFVQDDWRVTPTLTLNLGLRIEDHTPFHEIHNQEVNFAAGGLAAGGLQIEKGNSLYQNYFGVGSLLPRIGLSWSPAKLSGKTVVRAGYGISAYMEGGGVNQQMTANPPFTSAQFTQSFGSSVGNFADIFANAIVNQPCPTITIDCYQGVSTLRLFNPNFRPALAQQWNLTIQQQINNATTVQIGYVGQHGTHLYNFMQYTQAPLLDASGNIIKKPGVLGTPGQPLLLKNLSQQLGGGPAFANGNDSNGNQRYDALQAVLKHHMSKGLDAQVAYTYSKCMSDSGGFYGTWGSTQTSHGQVGWTNIFAPRMDWGPCFFDETHILSSYATYQVPVGRGKMFGNGMNRAMNAVVGGWELGAALTVHSGNAMSDFQGWGGQSEAYATNGASAEFGGDRSDCNGPVKYQKQFTGAGVQWFDKSTFSNPVPVGNQYSYGTCGQGGIRGPRYADVDLSLHKAFAVTEKYNFEFRAEAYNALNHVNLNAPDLNIESGTFGKITSAQSMRQFQMGLRFSF